MDYQTRSKLGGLVLALEAEATRIHVPPEVELGDPCINESEGPPYVVMSLTAQTDHPDPDKQQVGSEVWFLPYEPVTLLQQRVHDTYTEMRMLGANYGANLRSLSMGRKHESGST